MSITDDLRHLIDDHAGLIENTVTVFPRPHVVLHVDRVEDVASIAAAVGVEVKHDINERTHDRSVPVRRGDATLLFTHTSMRTEDDRVGSDGG